ncbi:enoyl-CoA hydratase/isomerase family protein [Pseudofrankia inefficax]|uniref:Enoyl-CoA hydratase/isomerase n=1 Tax=Pseudofrankia inefficax (strain DSM 45817 / CECT 9037 / DDB 130130 / EuI1c) TaxID=298654 RepID=E3J706_PSEI1|nr:enoyl-CoA hydratase/isomerase family protein [Pseudofrankia inefficax]ADP83226.1 Enoyl-CoA hydratase/isomerase [Pseudofrankia inefficax]
MTATLGAQPLPAATALDLVRSLQPADLADLFPAPILCVDLADAHPDDLTALAARRPPLLLVGVGPGADSGTGRHGDPGRGAEGALDVLLPEVLRPGDDVPAAVAALDRAVADHPEAAVALVGLLRMTPRLEPLDGLVAESLAYSTLLAGGDFARWLAARGPRPHRDADRPLLRRRDGDRLVLTFNRPEARNAFDTFTRDALVAALREASADATLTEVVLTANGPSFGAGGDLSQFGTAGDLARAHLVRTGASAGAEIIRCPHRVVAHLHGACVGAGIEIPAFADRVVAAPDVAIQLPELALGLVPGAGGTVSVTRRIGRRRTAWLVLTGTFLDAPTALRWGLIDAIEELRQVPASP